MLVPISRKASQTRMAHRCGVVLFLPVLYGKPNQSRKDVIAIKEPQLKNDSCLMDIDTHEG